MGSILRDMVDAHYVRRRRVAIAVIVGISIAIIAGYYAIGPESGIYPRCLFKELTGLDCPGCGSQRAIHTLLHGHVAEAWHYNALLLIEIPLVLLLGIAYALRRRVPRLHAVLNSRTVILALLSTIILWTIVRNIIII